MCAVLRAFATSGVMTLVEALEGMYRAAWPRRFVPACSERMGCDSPFRTRLMEVGE